MIAPRSDGRAAGLPIGPEGAVVVGDRTDTEDVESVAPLTAPVFDEDRASAFVEALDLGLARRLRGDLTIHIIVQALRPEPCLGQDWPMMGSRKRQPGRVRQTGHQALEPHRPSWHVRQESAGSAGRNGAVETRTAATTAARRSTILITIGCMSSPSKRQNSVERAGPITTMAITIEKREVCKTHCDSRCRFVLIRGTKRVQPLEIGK